MALYDMQTGYGDVAGGAMSGAQMGSVAGPYGMAAGALIGAGVGAYTSRRKNALIRKAKALHSQDVQRQRIEGVRENLQNRSDVNEQANREDQNLVEQNTARTGGMENSFLNYQEGQVERQRARNIEALNRQEDQMKWGWQFSDSMNALTKQYNRVNQMMSMMNSGNSGGAGGIVSGLAGGGQS